MIQYNRPRKAPKSLSDWLRMVILPSVAHNGRPAAPDGHAGLQAPPGGPSNLTLDLWGCTKCGMEVTAPHGWKPGACLRCGSHDGVVGPFSLPHLDKPGPDEPGQSWDANGSPV